VDDGGGEQHQEEASNLDRRGWFGSTDHIEFELMFIFIILLLQSTTIHTTTILTSHPVFILGKTGHVVQNITTASARVWSNAAAKYRVVFRLSKIQLRIHPKDKSLFKLFNYLIFVKIHYICSLLFGILITFLSF
jgi:hypothetical protein